LHRIVDLIERALGIDLGEALPVLFQTGVCEQPPGFLNS
jgi:hypothetical protein